MRARTLAAAALLVLATALAACGGGAVESSAPSAPPARLVGPAAFQAAMGEPARVTINVHVPDEGSIEGTSLWIPFDEVEAHAAELPPAGTPIALYCLRGDMSAEAAPVLARLGYSDIVELEGGFRAWESSGRPLLPPASR